MGVAAYLCGGVLLLCIFWGWGEGGGGGGGVDYNTDFTI